MIDKKIFMLCEKTTEEQIVNLNGDYAGNIKFDGERVISVIINHEVIMFNRRGKIVNFHFREVEEELKLLENCIIDGEVISWNNKFEDLQSRALTTNPYKAQQLVKQIPCDYMVFDILKYEENDLRNLPLSKRLENLILLFAGKEFKHIKKVEYKPINEVLFEAKQNSCEGIVIKDLNAKYESRRSRSWLKCKFFNETTMFIYSYTTNNAGIRAEDRLGNAVQIAGHNAIEVRKVMEEKGFAEIYIQYLTKTENNRFRFISYRGLKK